MARADIEREALEWARTAVACYREVIRRAPFITLPKSTLQLSRHIRLTPRFGLAVTLHHNASATQWDLMHFGKYLVRRERVAGTSRRLPEIEPNRLLDDLWRKAVAAIADFLHPLGYRTASGTASPNVTMPCTLFGVANLVPVQGLPGPNANNRLQQVPCLTLT